MRPLTSLSLSLHISDKGSSDVIAGEKIYRSGVSKSIHGRQSALHINIPRKREMSEIFAKKKWADKWSHHQQPVDLQHKMVIQLLIRHDRCTHCTKYNLYGIKENGKSQILHYVHKNRVNTHPCFRRLLQSDGWLAAVALQEEKNTVNPLVIEARMNLL